MVEVQIAPSARSDLEAIDDYGIDTFGIAAADAMSAAIRRAFAFLGEYPLSAALRPEFGEGLRCKAYRGYRILYRFDGAAVIILRVLHHSRAWPTGGNQ